MQFYSITKSVAVGMLIMLCYKKCAGDLRLLAL
jgi:hypothetical protein